MSAPIRVMIEQGKKKAVAAAFDWPGWERGSKSEDEALAVLAAYRPVTTGSQSSPGSPRTSAQPER